MENDSSDCTSGSIIESGSVARGAGELKIEVEFGGNGAE